MKTLVFIPMYNCERQISRVIDQVRDTSLTGNVTYLFVDNRSIDSTLATAEAHLRANLKSKSWVLVRNEKNYGLGGSHKVAFQYAFKGNYDRLIVLHGDDQARLDDVLPFIGQMDNLPSPECLLGARFLPSSRLEGYSKVRTVGNIIFNVLFGLAGLKPVFDLGSGLNIYSMKFIRRGIHFACADDLTFNYHLLLHTMSHNIPVRFFPISWRESDQRSNVKMARQALSMIGMLTLYVLGRKRFFLRLRSKHGLTLYDFEIIARNTP